LVFRYSATSPFITAGGRHSQISGREVSTLYSLGKKCFTPTETAASMMVFYCVVEKVTVAEATASLPLKTSRRDEWK
jgi:hypothetical protein